MHEENACKVTAAGLIVATGADGRVGRLIAQELAARIAPQYVRLCSPREPSTLAPLQAQGFHTARADYDDPASLDLAFAGAQTLLITSADGALDAAHRVRQHRNAIAAAQRAGVGRLVYMSFASPHANSLCTLAHPHAVTEDDLRASGLNITILRNNQFAENLDPVLERARNSSLLAAPGATGKVAYITRADAAAAIAGALTQPGHDGATYELTGPEAMDLFNIAAALSEARGVPVAAHDVAPEEFAPVLAALGLPPVIVRAMLSMYAAAAAGEYAMVTLDAPRLADRGIDSMRHYVRRFA